MFYFIAAFIFSARETTALTTKKTVVQCLTSQYAANRNDYHYMLIWFQAEQTQRLSPYISCNDRTPGPWADMGSAKYANSIGIACL